MKGIDVTLLRISAHEWEVEKRRVLSWSTQFNDLRPAPTREEGTPRDRCLFELKKQLLFDDALIIRDADLVNHIELLQLFDDNCQDFCSTVESGALVFALREKADSFSQVHNDAGPIRADPARFNETTKAQITKLDSFLEKRQIATVTITQTGTPDSFRGLLNRVLHKDHLTSTQYDALAQAIAYAELDEKAPFLRFGHIYDYLWKGIDPGRIDQDLLQWCRTAHVLTIPTQIKVPVASANRDLRPHKVQVVMGLSKRTAEIDGREWIDLYPEYIPEEEWIKKQTFREILAFRKIGDELGYFGALDRMRNIRQLSNHDYEFDRVCKGYFEALSAYLREIEIIGNYELVRWKKEFVHKIMRKEDLYDVLLSTFAGLAGTLAVPAVIGSHGLSSLFPLSSDITLIDPKYFTAVASTITGVAAATYKAKRLLWPSIFKQILDSSHTRPNS